MFFFTFRTQDLKLFPPYTMMRLSERLTGSFLLLQVICPTSRWSRCGRSWGGWERGICCDCTAASSWKETTRAASTSPWTDRRRTRSSSPGPRPCQPIRCGPCWVTLLRSVWWAAGMRGSVCERGVSEPADQQVAVVLYNCITQFTVLPLFFWELEKHRFGLEWLQSLTAILQLLQNNF